jgi:hypothetical protein
MKVGAEGIWSPGADGPVLWRDVRALRVTTLEVAGSTLAMLEAEVGSTAVGLSVDLPGADFDARATLIADRLLQYAVDHGIERAHWPTVDLVPRPPESSTPEQGLITADEKLARFEAFCAHSTDRQLGRFVEIEPDSRLLGIQGLLGLACIGAGVLFLRLSEDPSWAGRGVIVGLLCIVVGSWYVPNAVWMGLRGRRLRVGEHGLQVVPGSEPIMWGEVRSVDLSRGEIGLRLSVEVAGQGASADIAGKRGKRRFRLGPLEVPGKRGYRHLEVNSLLEAMLEASRVRN